METDGLDSEQLGASTNSENTPIDEGGGQGRDTEHRQDCDLLKVTDNIAIFSQIVDGAGAVVKMDSSMRPDASPVQQREDMDLDVRDGSMMEDADEGEEKQNGISSRLCRIVTASPPSSSSSSSSSWPRINSKWLSRKRRQTDWDDNSTATPDGNEVVASADVNVALSEEEEEEDQEMKKRRRNIGDHMDDDEGGGAGNHVGGSGDVGGRVDEDEEHNEDEDEEDDEEDSNDQYFDLFVSDSEDEESRNEWNRRRPAVFLRPRSDNDRHGNSDRNAQEVVTRRMRSEYKPANNRCSLLVQSPPQCPRRSNSSTPASNHKEEVCEPLVWRRPPERCLLTLLRMREIGGRLGGRYGEVRWSGGSGFTRQIRRSSHMLRRMRRRSVLSVHSGCVNALNFSPVDGNLIASGSDDQHLAITDWMREKVVTKFDSGHEMNVFQTKFLYESQNLLLASCARDGMVRLSQMNSSGDLVLSKLLFHHNDSCNKVAVHPHEPHSLISSGEDSLVVHMDIREPDSENRYFQAYDVKRASTVPLYSIHMHPLKSYEFCVCGRNPTIRVYDRRKISWSSVGARLSSSRSDLTQEYNEPVQSFCAFSELPGGQGKEKELWDKLEEGGELLEVEEEKEEEEEESEVRRRKSDDKEVGATSGSPDKEEKEPASDSTYLVNLHVTSAVYSNNGDAILSSYNDADIFLFDTKAGREERPTHKYCGHRNNTTVKCVNFYGPDSEYIVSGSDCGNIFFWSRVSEQIANFQPGDNLGVVNVLEAHPTLPVLATSGLDSDIKIWTPDWNDELEEVSSKRWPFEEKALGRTVLENWMDRESAKRMLIGQSTLLRMLRIALERTSRPRDSMDAGDGDSDEEEGDEETGAGRDDDSDSDSDGGGRRRSRRRDFCVQS